MHLSNPIIHVKNKTMCIIIQNWARGVTNKNMNHSHVFLLTINFYNSLLDSIKYQFCGPSCLKQYKFLLSSKFVCMQSEMWLFILYIILVSLKLTFSLGILCVLGMIVWCMWGSLLWLALSRICSLICLLCKWWCLRDDLYMLPSLQITNI
jgi:hypothetical protein